MSLQHNAAAEAASAYLCTYLSLCIFPLSTIVLPFVSVIGFGFLPRSLYASYKREGEEKGRGFVSVTEESTGDYFLPALTTRLREESDISSPLPMKREGER